MIDGKMETVACVSRKSNPPSELKWFLGDKVLTSPVQNNTPEVDDERKWRSYSKLEYIFTPNDSGKLLTCRVYHPGYTDNPQEAPVSLNILCKCSNVA